MTDEASEIDPRVARTSAAVLAAGEAILTERGVHGITVDEVARRTGIAKTTIYRHWPSKAQLVLAVIARQAFEFPSPDTGDPVNDLRICLSALSQAMSEPRRRVALLGVLELGARDAPAERVHRETMLNVRSATLLDVFRRAAASRLRHADSRAALMLQMLVGPIMLRALVYGEALDEDSLDALIEYVLGPTSES